MISNGQSVPLGDVPRVSLARFRELLRESMGAGAHVSAFFGHPEDGRLFLYAVMSHGLENALSIFATEVADAYPALTPECPPLHAFERELWERWGVRPEGHPWLKPVRWPAGGSPGVTDYFHVRGEEVHEVAVGPVHAGIIEPGHFRFQCHGETVFHLEISLGYQQRGVERAMAGGPTKRAIPYMETLAGDTTVGHATAYCELVESLAGARAPLRAQVIRAIALELERLANHTGDLGALAGDVAYLPTAAFCGRLRGEWLNLTALLCGSRFGRGLVRPGGVGFDVEPGRVAELARRAERALKDVAQAAGLLWNSPSVTARFEGMGALSKETAVELGFVGPTARASGLERDVRQDLPSGLYRFTHIPVSTWHGGDVFARAYVRWLEIQQSVAFVQAQLRSLPGGPVRAGCGKLAPRRIAATVVEGWRGEICHAAITDAEGRFASYKVVDPSFHNWFGVATAMRDQQISDFPLCNKSFNLSYCGHDL